MTRGWQSFAQVTTVTRYRARTSRRWPKLGKAAETRTVRDKAFDGLSVGDLVGGEVGLALLGEGGRAFPGLVGHGEDVQARLRHLGQAALVVGVGVERVLEEADRGRAVLRELVHPGLGGGHQLLGRYDLVD